MVRPNRTQTTGKSNTENVRVKGLRKASRCSRPVQREETYLLDLTEPAAGSPPPALSSLRGVWVCEFDKGPRATVSPTEESHRPQKLLPSSEALAAAGPQPPQLRLRKLSHTQDRTICSLWGPASSTQHDARGSVCIAADTGARSFRRPRSAPPHARPAICVFVPVVTIANELLETVRV